ncbi:MAG: malic enzyme-like NAD(P)-binding protein [Gammaproteobacteria bacterium]|nr:malic enzyme-like NAD(P)-binding protein [Gammaproteobacteria bacterium]
MPDQLRNAALAYHADPKPGKLSVEITKSTHTQYDLSLSYTPGVAEPVKEIAKHAEAAYLYTGKGNLVAVISNGTAVLGLGNVGALASKPVMEGKAVLFKRFADINVFDIEVECTDPTDFVDTVARIAPTFGGINLEDIKAPECFEIESALCKRLDIPVFHDDQHGTAIVVAAGLLNALELQGKRLEDVDIVCAGAGAAGVASMQLLLELGADPQRLLMIDRSGVIHADRTDLNSFKQRFAVKTAKRTLADAVDGADVFIGVSGPDVLSAEMLKTMALKPVIFALSNPVPEIMPELAHSVRKDLIMATGRGDFPNQVNNALCFPYMFRGALDVRARSINEDMKLAAVHAIKDLVKVPFTASERELSNEPELTFGPTYILPTLMDPRLRTKVSLAVSKAAIDSGVAQLKLSQENFS